MEYQVPDDANYKGGSFQDNTGDFQVLPDKTKVSFTINKAEIRDKLLRGTPRKSLNLGLIVVDMETGNKNFVWDSLYIDGEVWLEKDKKGNPWMVNQFLAFSNACGLREQGSRVLHAEWFDDASCYENLVGEAVVSKTTYNNQYRNEIRYYVQRAKQKAKQPSMMPSNSGVKVETFNPDDDPDDDIPF